MQVEINVEKICQLADYKTPNGESFICDLWVRMFFGVTDKKITVCFSDEPHIDSYFFSVRGGTWPHNHVTIYEGDTRFGTPLYGPGRYVYDELFRFVFKHFPSGQAYISIYVEVS
jgi:hypothetical protein